MERDRFDLDFGKKLKEEVSSINMSSSLKEAIKKSTTMRKMTPYDKFKRFMNTTIEIPAPSMLVACVVIFFLGFTAFRVTEVMKKDESIKGYTSVKIVNMGGAQVIVEKDWGIKNEEN